VEAFLGGGEDGPGGWWPRYPHSALFNLRALLELYATVQYNKITINVYIYIYISPPVSSPTPGVFYTYFYNHARRLHLERLLYPELSRSPNGFFKALLDLGGGFRSKTAVTKPFRN
jgi:hypothetical protein